MTVHIFIDTEVLGPTRTIEGVEHRELIARVSAAYTGTEPPPEPELRLLQPWNWLEIRWQAFDEISAPLAGLQRLAPPGEVEELATLTAAIARRFLAPVDPDPNSTTPDYYWTARSNDDDEDPDGPDQMYWPETLADMAQWPGLLPYHCQVSFAFTLPAEVLGSGRAFLMIESLKLEDRTHVAVQPGTVVDGKLSATTADGSVVLESLSGSAPQAPQADQIIDLQQLYIGPRAGAQNMGADWQQGLPDDLAGALNPAALIPAVLAKRWSDDEPPAAHKEQAIVAAKASYRQLLRHLLMPGLDGGPPYGWLLDLAMDGVDQGNALAVRDAARLCGAALKAHPANLDEETIDRISHDQTYPDNPWPATDLPSEVIRERLNLALTARLSDASLLDLPLRLLETEQASAELIAAIETIRGWTSQYLADARQDHNRARPPQANRLLLRSWLATPLTDPDDPRKDPVAPWIAYLAEVADSARKYPAIDDWNIHVRTVTVDDQSSTALAVLAQLSCQETGLKLPQSWSGDCVEILKAGFAELPNPGALTSQLQDLHLTVDRPDSVAMDLADDLSSRVAGYVGLVRQSLGDLTSAWYPLNLAKASVVLADTTIDLGTVLAPQPITYVEGQRRLLQIYDGSAWVDDVRDKALGQQLGEQDTNQTQHLGLSIQLSLNPQAPIPTLKDGVQFEFALPVIAAGNALHPDFRGASGHPADLDPATLPNVNVDQALIHTVRAARSLRVGAPLLRPLEADGWHDRRRSPVVPLAYEWIRGAREKSVQIAGISATALEKLSDAPLSLLVPEAGWAGSSSHQFEISPPQIGQAAWLRWWDRTRLETAEDATGPIEARIRAGLRMALKLADTATDAQSPLEPPGFDDPAVAGYLIQWRCLFDGATSAATGFQFVAVEDHYPGDDSAADAIGRMAMRPLTRPSLAIIASNGGPEQIELTDQGAQLRCKPGHVYAIEISAAVKDSEFANGPDSQARFGMASELTSRHEHGGILYRLFEGSALLVEVATDAQPTAEALWHAFKVANLNDKLSVALDYQSGVNLEYYDRYRTQIQQWTWRGRPVTARPPGNDQSQPYQDWINALFDGRSERDGQEIERRSTANGQSTRLFERNLADNDRASLWRFGLSAESRYTSIAPRPLQVIAEIALPNEPTARFRCLEIRQRGERLMPKPKVRICLPLMREVPLTSAQGGGEQLGFLVELDESWHQEAGPAELLVAEVVTAPHYVEVGKGPQSLLEIGTVPTIATDIWNGSAPLQTVAVYGQSLDPDSSAARYSRATAVVTLSAAATAAAKGRWNTGTLLLKTHFGRRVSTPLDTRSEATQHAEQSQWSADYWIELPPPSNRVGPYPIEQLQLKAVASGRVQLRHRADGKALRLQASEMARPFGWLILTEQVYDARGLLNSERLVDVQLLEPDLDAPAWRINEQRLERLSGYVYWIEPQRRAGDYVRPTREGIEALADLFQTLRDSGAVDSDDARLRIVQLTRAIKAGK